MAPASSPPNPPDRPAEPGGDPDPWVAARATVRGEVAAALGPRPRTCPSCGRVEATAERHCPHCGADYFARRPRPRPSRRTVIAGLLSLAVVAAVVVAVVPGLRRDAGERSAREQARYEALVAAEKRRLTIDARPRRVAGAPRATGQTVLAGRAALVETAEAAITRDARARVRAGSIDGPILGTRCEPFPATEGRRALERDPTARRLRYECVAVKREVELSELEGKQRTGLYGYPFWAVLDGARSAVVFCKVTPRAGEGAKSLASVPVPVPCRDPQRVGAG